MMRVHPDFYTQSAVSMAPELLGKILCRRVDGEILRYRITETEAYSGQDDTACHAHRGKTPRNSVMYEAGGAVYIYLCYGIHNLLNVVSGDEGEPEAVLIRGVEGYPGPGKLTKAMRIGRELNRVNLITSDLLWLEDDGVKPQYKATPRIGIDYADERDRLRLWRFVCV